MQNTVNGRLKVTSSPTTVSSTYSSLVSAPFGSQQNMVAPSSMHTSASGARNNVSMTTGAAAGGFQQLSPRVQHHVALTTVREDAGRLSLVQRQRQQHMSGGGLQMRVSSVMPGDIDVSLQELQAGGLSCDMEQILRDGNLDLIVD